MTIQPRTALSSTVGKMLGTGWCSTCINATTRLHQCKIEPRGAQPCPGYTIKKEDK